MSNPKRWLWLLCMVITSSFLFAACTDDGGTGDDNPDTTGGDTNECNETECMLRGQICDPAGSGMCVPDSEGDCAEVGALCDPALSQPAGFVCLEGSDGNGACTLTCENFFDTTTCPSGQKCYPGQFIGRDDGFCDAAGTGAEGSTCSGSLGACAQGLMCLPVAQSVFQCLAPDCSPLTTTRACEAGDECSGGFQLTDGSTLDIGFCFTPCTAFADNSGCEANEFCTPTTRNTSTGGLDGQCTEANTGINTQGQTCSSDNDCAREYICLSGACSLVCDIEADAGEAGSCETGFGCSGLTSGSGDALPFGACSETCDYDNPDVDGCDDAGDLCRPGDVFADDSGIDFCLASSGFLDVEPLQACPSMMGVDENGDPVEENFGRFCGANAICLDFAILEGYSEEDLLCIPLCRFSEGQAGATDHPDCGLDQFCMTVFTDAIQAGACQPYDCDPEAAAGETGACADPDDICRPISTENANIGRCVEGCDYETDSTCSEAGDTCYPAYYLALFGGSSELPMPDSDICDSLEPADVTNYPLNERAACAEADGYTEGVSCGPTSVCLELDQLAPGVLCYDTCDLTKGAGENNPDCNAGRTCQQIFTGIEVGICAG